MTIIITERNIGGCDVQKKAMHNNNVVKPRKSSARMGWYLVLTENGICNNNFSNRMQINSNNDEKTVIALFTKWNTINTILQ